MSGQAPFRVAAVQAAPVYMDLTGCVEKAVRLIKEAAAQGARLVAFPETWIPGYPWWAWLGAPIWGMQFVQRYHANSIERGSREAAALQDAAREHGVYVVMGVSEREAGSLYIGQLLIGADGE